MNSIAREDLYRALNDLLEEQFEEFKWRLICIDHSGKPNIPPASLEKANRQEVVDLLIQNYVEGAPEVCIRVLQKSNINDVAKKLEETLQKVADADAPQPPDSSELMILAYCLQHCQNLQKLCVRGPTSIYPTEKEMFLLEHRQCGLDEVCMEDFFQSLTKLRNLRVLRLEKWSFTQSCSKQLVEVFKTNQKLKEFNLFLKDTNERAMELLCEGLRHPDCEIEILEVGGEAMTEYLAEVFRRNQSLRDLKLWLFCPKYRVVRSLCEGLQDPDCRVEKLWLNEEFVNEPYSRHVAEVLRRNQRLRELWLCLIYPQNEALRMLYKGLKHPDCKVERLWIHEDFVKSCSRHFLEVLKKNQRLRELQLFLYILDEEVEEMLCEGLQHPDCKIEKLRLEGQFLKESFCRRFAEILMKNQRLRELDLFPDYLDDRVIEMLCKGLKHPDCKIEKLGLGAKFLTQPFSRQFTRVLRMRDLELFPTYREDRAAKMLPAGLKYSNCKLKALRINGEYMKEYLGSQIAGIVKINQKLRELHLHGDCISDYEMKLLWEELKHSGHKLKELWLNGKHIVQKGEWMDPEHVARAPSVNAASLCLLV
ncbi:ribonuclease inhibitor-like isoform X2 [Crotalus tigris]|uniref:ribonuclease inhibitor-like isoform X2 n=1 Tax=Crotalus tigris TaxID=88082 RepID=UPI00192FB43E|nr:ribonuclease inhibitor-like isoform X2 [Crotalus tigris]